MKSEDKTTHVTFRQAQWYVASLRKLWFVASGQVLLHHLCTSSSSYPIDRPWYMVCGIALIGGLWTRHGRWSVSKPWYVTCGQAYIYMACGIWFVENLGTYLWTSVESSSFRTSPSKWPVAKPCYVVGGQALVITKLQQVKFKCSCQVNQTF